jgi:nucleoporin NUP159
MSVAIHDSRKKFEEVGTSRGGSRNRRDLSDPSKWGLSDLVQFGQILQQYEGELDKLATQNETKLQALREIKSNMLKGKLLLTRCA